MKRYASELTTTGQELIMRAAIRVVSAFDYPGDSHQAALDELAATLGISQAHYRGLMAELSHDE